MTSTTSGLLSKAVSNSPIGQWPGDLMSTTASTARPRTSGLTSIVNFSIVPSVLNLWRRWRVAEWLLPTSSDNSVTEARLSTTNAQRIWLSISSMATTLAV